MEKHIDYIGRRGDLDLETDDGSQLQGKGIGKDLLNDWDLDLETHQRESEFAKTRGRPAPKLVHKLMFSMPPGTPPQGVLAAVRNFAREEFALKHRYAMVLHTDDPHPHVHVVVKAVSEQGVRLNIRKPTLRKRAACSDSSPRIRLRAAQELGAEETFRQPNQIVTCRQSDAVCKGRWWSGCHPMTADGCLTVGHGGA